MSDEPKHEPLKDARTLLDIGLLTMQRDLHRLSSLSLSGDLEANDASTLTNYVKTLLSVAKEERQAAKEMNLSEMSDEELEQQLQEYAQRDTE